MLGELELAIMPDVTHPYFHGRRTVVRFRLAMQADVQRVAEKKVVGHAVDHDREAEVDIKISSHMDLATCRFGTEPKPMPAAYSAAVAPTAPINDHVPLDTNLHIISVA
jgi:hypothetical protein